MNLLTRFHRALIFLVIVYFMSLGGTYTGLTGTTLQSISLAILTIGIAAWLLTRRFRLGQTPLDAALLFWLLAYAVSSLPHLSGRVYIGLWYAGLYLGIWLVLADLRQHGLPAAWITGSALFTSIPIMFFALAQVQSWFPQWLKTSAVRVAFVPPRPTSIYGNPNILGTVLIMLLPFALVRIRWAAHKLDRTVWSVWLFLALLILYLTYSRGAWFGGVSGLLTFALVLYRNPIEWWHTLSFRFRLALISSAVLILIVALVTLSAFNTPRRSASHRLQLYNIALDEFAAHPLVGSGPFTFGLALLENLSIPPLQPHAHAHDLPLNIAAELGLLGLLAFTLTLVLLLKQFSRVFRLAPDSQSRAYTVACLSSLVAFGAQSLVDLTVMVPSIMLLLLVIMSLLVQPKSDPLPSRSPYRLRFVLSVFLWLPLLIAGWWYVSVYRDYMRGQLALLAGDYPRSASILRQVAEDQPALALHHAAYAYASGLAASNGDTAYLTEGIAAYRRALDQERPHAVWWTNLAALYWQSGDQTRAVEAMRQAVHFASEDPDIWLNFAIYSEEFGQTDQAVFAYRRVLELDPAWSYNTQFWTASPLREQVYSTLSLDPSPYQLARTLWQNGQPAAALDLLEDRISRDPSQPKPYVQIARLYIAAGQLDRAADYLDAAYLLVHEDINLAWIRYAESQIAYVRGDLALEKELLQEARDYIWPDPTGQPIFYGRDITNYQFLHDTVIGVLLPQVYTLGPDPELVSLLR
ncbi:MAG TPA: O-antigen ligase family protein [Aggregatilineaceae bacterium]|nr:O-antigen ligase family protein [Aggregatilineaceae bacterium]